MSYIPVTENDRKEMLAAIGIDSVEELFSEIPLKDRFPEFNIPGAVSEYEALAEIDELAGKNKNFPSFLGGGVYHHFVPSIVDYLAGRGEFVTPYTPYQPEASQGTLRAHFEFQTMITALTGMDYAIVSHYDGATAFAESAMMAINFSRGKNKKIIALNNINPDYINVAKTYLQYQGEIVDGIEDFEGIAAVAVQNPDYFGNILSPAELKKIAENAHKNDAKLIVITTPVFLGMFAPPECADIVVMEGQPFGNHLSFGGPYLGVLTMKKEMVRVSTGRIVGETVDANGKKGYVLTLSAREQHIRREKAASNICSNEALCALRAAIFMAALGKNGMRKLAEICYHKAHYLANEISKINGFSIANTMPFFNEFIIDCPVPASKINGILKEKYNITGGIAVNETQMIVAVTEILSKQSLDSFVSALSEIGRKA